jgi:hypothetical protein
MVCRCTWRTCANWLIVSPNAALMALTRSARDCAAGADSSGAASGGGAWVISVTDAVESCAG